MMVGDHLTRCCPPGALPGPGPSPHLNDGALSALRHNHEETRARRRVVWISRQLIMHRALLQPGQRPAYGGVARGARQQSAPRPDTCCTAACISCAN